MTHPAFDLVRETTIPEIASGATLYRHKKTGAEVLSLANDDENKVFGITFRTPPADSTGVAHILEHSVLCGSRKYPVKKPFVELLKGSLQTFLNAMTYPDKTAYPVASQNLQDFYNLVDVYLDAVFFPLISEDTFRQEGWHYELDSTQGPMVYKGVVFNEMKGAYSSPAAVLAKASQQSLYPETTYGVNSGGDPKAIPDLTYEDFKAFHARFYHPSNARIVFYGDDAPEQRLAILEEYLSQFEPIRPVSDIALQPRWQSPRKEVVTYSASEAEAGKKTGMISVNWMLDEIADPGELLVLNVLEQALVGTAASPLRKALTDSGLGEGLTGSGFAEEYRQPYFTVGLKGIDEADGDAVEALILSTLERLAREGLDAETVEAALNTIEFRLRENNTGSYPRGLAVMFRSMRSWLYEQDPLSPLAFEKPLADLKARLAAGERVFEDLIARHIVNNSHRSTVLLKADTGQAAREAAEERARLDAARARMDAAAAQEVAEITRNLKALQEAEDAPEALAQIPALGLADLPRTNKPIPSAWDEIAGIPVMTHDLPTGGIVYLDLAFDMRVLPARLLPLMPIFSRALFQTGTAKEDFVSLSQRMGRSTGGIGAMRWASARRDTGEAAARLFLRGKAVPDKVGEMLAIITDVVGSARLDNKARIRQLVLEDKAGFESGLAGRGNGIVNMRLRARFNEADWATEEMSGVQSLFFLRELITRIDTDWESVEADLEAIRTVLLGRAGLIGNLTTDAATLGTVRPLLGDFLSALPAGSGAIAPWQTDATKGAEALTFPGQVNYVGKGADLSALGFEPTGASAVAVRHMNTTYMWDKVRVQGGAYGGSASLDPQAKTLSFLSYRDPNLLETLAVYDKAAAFMAKGIGEQDLVRSVIGVIGSIDAHRLPDAKGFAALMFHLMGETDESRQARREEVLGTTAADFRRFAEVLGEVANRGEVVVLGSAEAAAKANEDKALFARITRVL
ncbi:pre-sequence protease. Metallo peptidase. MEROPS family M16C [Devosia enhydra]|uniref:Pre-sequence protease. Metallo peptidase. MEROPS family M16C n=1 Tax=Devosia enhydra TaxID=665118 RepID=A0A1K2HXE9_9HYPH|nr:insulinase family protein [Devosia enhydra]SFZ83719.1 pre-sequence protease. Metallo peptidase. MEROPS family M16C [Devosia enhydra]